MQVDLTKIPAYVINLEDAVERRETSLRRLKSLGINAEIHPGIRHGRSIIGCGMAHVSALKKITPPAIVFEDDINTTGAFVESLVVPDAADALYLGVSRWGFVSGDQPGRIDSVVYDQYDSNYRRLYNMCSLHAVVYLSQQYIDSCIRTAETWIAANNAFDLGIAGTHGSYTILTPNLPFFYQDSKFSDTFSLGESA